jgi:hypothetical protein
MSLHANSFILNRLLALPFQKRIRAFKSMSGSVIIGVFLSLNNYS